MIAKLATHSSVLFWRIQDEGSLVVVNQDEESAHQQQTSSSSSMSNFFANSGPAASSSRGLGILPGKNTAAYFLSRESSWDPGLNTSLVNCCMITYHLATWEAQNQILGHRKYIIHLYNYHFAELWVRGTGYSTQNWITLARNQWLEIFQLYYFQQELVKQSRVETMDLAEEYQLSFHSSFGGSRKGISRLGLSRTKGRNGFIQAGT